MTKTWIIVIAVLAALIGIYEYNSMSKYDEQVVDAWKPLQSALKIRYDSIPRLIPAITLYAGHDIPEAKELAKVLPDFAKATTIEEQTKAANTIEDRLQKLYQFTSDRYPGIMENNQIVAIKATMQKSVGEVALAMTAYNKAAEKYDSYTREFPNNIVAVIFGFAERYEYIQPQM